MVLYALGLVFQGGLFGMKKIGITSIGAYIPYYYLDRKIIAETWGSRSAKGVRSIANVDEDSATLAVESMRQCFKYVDKQEIENIYFASTTAPYAEKSTAGLVSNVCDLPRNVLATDVLGCTKAGTTALRSAMNAVCAAPQSQAVVAAADCRNAFPNSSREQLLGDASAAIVVGTENLLATIDGFATVTDEIVDIWRNPGDSFLNSAEGRFITDKGYMNSMVQVIKDILEKSGLQPDDIDKIILTTPGFKEHQRLAKAAGFSPDQVQDPLMMEVGDCGTAQALLLLVAALEESKPGDKLLLANYGNGADAFVFTVTDHIGMIQKSGLIKSYLANRAGFVNYGRFLSFRGILPMEPEPPYKIPASSSISWREQGTYLRFEGSRCKKCGIEIFPVNRVCSNCHSIDEFEKIHCAERRARIFDFTIDRLAGRSDDPVVGQIVAEDDKGVRYYTTMTDFRPEQIAIGSEVEFAFRKIHMMANFSNYYWKSRPIRIQGDKRK